MSFACCVQQSRSSYKHKRRETLLHQHQKCLASEKIWKILMHLSWCCQHRSKQSILDNALCYFRNQDSQTKQGLFRLYYMRIRIWTLVTISACTNKFCVAWWMALSRLWNLTYNANSDLLPALCQCLLTMWISFSTVLTIWRLQLIAPHAKVTIIAWHVLCMCCFYNMA